MEFFYNDKVLDHLFNPRNVGEISDPDGVGSIGDPGCGDLIKVYIRVCNYRLTEVKFKVFGCGAAIASGSAMTELATGMTLQEAIDITDDDISEALGGLPLDKLHCSNLGSGALHAAIADYLVRQGWADGDDLYEEEEFVD
ncbi:MAG: iron-sulfur cluster assembly scaffold protein [bacterium]|nr:iron-sulfur cluster assembly scaffold protein [bacterium]